MWLIPKRPTGIGRRGTAQGMALLLSAVVLVGGLVWAALAWGAEPHDRYETVVAEDAPAAQYRFDDAAASSTLADSAGSNTATNTGITLAGEGPFGGSKSGTFGGESYATLGSNPLAGAGEFTAETWVKWSGGASYKQPILDFGSSSTNYLYLTPASALTSHKLLFEIHTSGGSVAQVTSTTLAASAWHYLAVTETNSGTLTLYLDGTQVGQTTGLTVFPSSLGSASTDYLGKSLISGDPSFKGSLSNLAFYTKALSAARVLAHYNAGEFPVDTTLPTITGVARDGSVLTANHGSWTGLAPITFAYQWTRCNTSGAECTNIGESTSETKRTLEPADVGRTIRVAVKGSNGAGEGTATSAQTATIEPLAPANTSLPVISGEARDGQQLSVSEGSWTGTPPISYTYQWQSCNSSGASCKAITGATSASYGVIASEIGKTLRAVVTAKNAAGSKGATSAASAVVTAAPPANTTAPSVSGSAEEGQSLTASVGSWSGTPPLAYAYQWQRCTSLGEGCLPISGASSASYAPQAADVGMTVRVAVTATNSAGEATAQSPPTASVAPAPPVNAQPPAIGGLAKYGETLTSSNGTWSGTPPLGYAFQWKRCNGAGEACTNIEGATSSTYVPGHADLAHRLIVVVTAENSRGSSTASSSDSLPIAESPPTNMQPPTLEGTAQDGQTLIASAGSWTGLPLTSYTYQWQRCDSAGGGCADIPGATGSSYTAGVEDVWARLRVAVSATDDGGATIAYSDASTLVSPLAPSATALPEISGEAREGEALTAGTGAWIGTPPLSYSYQWEDCAALGEACLAIAGATSSTYIPQATDVGDTLAVTVTATNWAGANPATSGHSAIIVASSPADVVEPEIIGTPRVEQVLTASPGEWTGTPPVSYAYQWKRCNAQGQACLEIGGATAQTYHVASADLSQTLVVAVTASNTAGSATVASPPTPAVLGASAPPESVVAPSLEGSLTVGQTLTVNPGKWSGSSPMAFEYEWQSCKAEEKECRTIEEQVCEKFTEEDEEGEETEEELCEDVPVDASKYTLREQDVGRTIQALVYASNSAGIQVASAYRVEAVGTVGPPANHELPTVLGVVETGEQLFADNGSWSGSRPLSYSYQWERCDAKGENCTPVENATSATYTVLTADAGFTFKVSVTATNSLGSSTATSALTKSSAEVSWTTGWDSRAPGNTPGRPTWSHGPLTVSLVSGNVMVSFPGPTFPSATGSLGVQVTWNSLPPQAPPTCLPHPCTPPADYSASARSSGLGAGTTISVGEEGARRPTQLIDHSDLTGSSKFDKIEVLYGEGASEFLAPVNAANELYVQQTPDGTPTDNGLVLSRDPSGNNSVATPAWTLREADGLTSTFGVTDSASGVAPVTGAELQTSATGAPKLTYSYSALHAGLLTSVSDSSGRTINLDWHLIDPSGCSDAVLCITGPDGRTWRYIGQEGGGTAGRLFRVNDGTRDVMKFEGDAIYDADDLDPTHASPGYNAAHKLRIEYCSSPGSVSCPARAVKGVVEEGVTSAGEETNPGWGFKYGGVSTYKSSLPAVAGNPKYLTRIWPPNQGGPGTATGVKQWTFADANGHTLETIATGGLTPSYNGFLYRYDAAGRLLWSQTPSGARTSNSYAAGSGLLTQTSQPQAQDGSTPVTHYRYDETSMGSPSVPGSALVGLRAAYYANPSLAGLPAATQTDPQSGSGPAVDHNWSAEGPAALHGRREDFSVSWSGVLADVAGGTYTFDVTADDGVRLLVDEKPVIEAVESSGTRVLRGEVGLSPGNHRIELEYLQKRHAAGIHLSWTTPGGEEHPIEASFVRPAYGNRTSTISPTGRLSFSHYANPASALADYTVASAGTLNYITSYRYDSLGRVTEKDMPKANLARGIGEAGTLTGSPDQRYSTKYYFYAPGQLAAPPPDCPSAPPANQGGLLERVSTYGEASKVTVYDADGRPLATTSGAGSHCIAYDSEGNLVSERVPGDPAVPACPEADATACYTFDPAGRTLTARNASGTVALIYDELGRVTHSAQSSGGTTLSEATLGYDKDSNLTSETVSSGPAGSNPTYTTRKTYDASDNWTGTKDPVLVKFQSGVGYSGEFIYDAFDYRLVEMGVGYKTLTYFTYDPGGSLTGVFNRHGEAPIVGSPDETPPEDALGSPIADYRYEYDPEERQTQQTLTGGGISPATQAYSYDADGRLSSVTLPNATENHYTYDADSNRLTESQTPPAGAQTQVQSLSYEPSATPGVDQLTRSTTNGATTTYGYTRDGEVSSRGADTLKWDGAGVQLGGTFAGTPVSYTYDALGRLQERSTNAPSSTIRYLYAGSSNEPFAQTDANGTISSFVVSGPTGPFKIFHAAPSEAKTPYSYRYYDAHGNVIAEADESGSRTSSSTYDVFGSSNASAATNTLSVGYVGRWQKPLDTKSDLFIMGARPYDPTIGRFFSIDPAEGGSLNDYDYTNADPVNESDPAGLCPTATTAVRGKTPAEKWAEHECDVRREKEPSARRKAIGDFTGRIVKERGRQGEYSWQLEYMPPLPLEIGGPLSTSTMWCHVVFSRYNGHYHADLETHFRSYATGVNPGTLLG